jgi:hypothetical protein
VKNLTVLLILAMGAWPLTAQSVFGEEKGPPGKSRFGFDVLYNPPKDQKICRYGQALDLKSNLPAGSHRYIVLNKDGQIKDLEQFALIQTANDQWHFESGVDGNNQYPENKPVYNKHGLLTWNERFRFIKEGKGWANLSLQDAESFWGKPTVSKESDAEVYSFNIKTRPPIDGNDFVLDLQSNAHGELTAYRVRSQTIKDQKWFSQ